MAASSGFKPTEGTLRWEVDKDSISKEDLFSPSIEVGGINWALRVSLNEDDLAVSLRHMGGEYKLRSVGTVFTLELIHPENETESIRRKYPAEYGKKFDWVNPKYIKWDDLLEKGFIKDNKFTVQSNFSLHNVTGYRKLHPVDFTDLNDPSRGSALVVDGEKLYVGKEYLSTFSPVFHAMFYGNFAEKNQEEIELKDIDRKEFIEMLSVIYPPYKDISAENYDSLLKLGDRFAIDKVINQVEQFLIDTIKQTVSAKLLIADRFRLYKLLDHCLDQLKTMEDVKELKNKQEFVMYTEVVHAPLLNKIMDLAL